MYACQHYNSYWVDLRPCSFLFIYPGKREYYPKTPRLPWKIIPFTYIPPLRMQNYISSEFINQLLGKQKFHKYSFSINIWTCWVSKATSVESLLLKAQQGYICLHLLHFPSQQDSLSMSEKSEICSFKSFHAMLSVTLNSLSPFIFHCNVLLLFKDFRDQ